MFCSSKDKIEYAAIDDQVRHVEGLCKEGSIDCPISQLRAHVKH